jgi:hypothetical protein
MKRFESSPQFEKNFKQLFRKYKTLQGDFEKLKAILVQYPTGVGKNFIITHAEQECKIIKARMACRALHDRSLRVIYAYQEAAERFYFIEIYFKGEQVNENRRLIKEFLSQFSKWSCPESPN